MEEAAGQPSVEVCHRCLQPVAANAQRCPKCGERRTPANRLLMLIGILGLLVLVFVAVIMVTASRNSAINSTPPDQTEQSAPQQPDKPPPLNQ
jgi:hypothetical protein